MNQHESARWHYSTTLKTLKEGQSPLSCHFLLTTCSFTMVAFWNLVALGCSVNVAFATCPYMQNDARDLPANHPALRRDGSASTDSFMSQYEVDDSDVYLTSDVGGPFADQNSLSIGDRGPTLLEDFVFRQKVGIAPCRIYQVTYMSRSCTLVNFSLASS